MNSKDLNQLLLDSFPELKDKFYEETEWQEGIDTGSTVVYEDVFMPFILETFEQENIDMLTRIFQFIEEVSLINDEYAKNVIRLSIIDNFHYYDQLKIVNTC